MNFGFAILDFGLGTKNLSRNVSPKLVSIRSGNPKPKIQNPKWVGIVAIAVAFAMCGAVAQAQQAKKVPRIGYLSSVDPARESTRFEPFRLALRERGYIEGQNIATEYRYTEGKLDRAPELLAELVRLNVDIIVVAGGVRLILAGQECNQDHSHCYDGRWARSCRGRPD